MFDLDEEIAKWSATFSGRCGRETEVTELEDHLRSTFEVLSAEGIAPEIAFEVAVGKLGNAVDIRAEYEKNRSPLARFHSRLERWAGSGSGKVGRQQELGLAVIFASLMIALSIVLADSGNGAGAAAVYLPFVIVPLWLASRALVSRR